MSEQMRSAEVEMLQEGLVEVNRDVHELEGALAKERANVARLTATVERWQSAPPRKVVVARAESAEEALGRVRELADRLKASGVVSVYESALEIGQAIEDALDGAK